jgi:TolB-like protein/DNA-binding winged helix-turn-helix (wHTH) protein
LWREAIAAARKGTRSDVLPASPEDRQGAYNRCGSALDRAGRYGSAMTSGPSSFRFGVFDVDVRAAELRRGGEKVNLQEQPFQVLLLLLEHPGAVVTREELRQRLWPADTFVDFDQGLNAAIHRLRHALEDAAEAPRFIETIPRHGYRFVATVESGPSCGERRVWRRSAHLRTVIAVVVVVLVAVVFERRMRDAVWLPESPTRISAIAVLPLANLSGDPAQEYLTDGLTEALITELARAMPLKVVSRTSAMAYKGRQKPLKQAAQELGVDGVLEGALVRSGTRLRITVQLVAASTDRHVWAESFDRDESDLLALQADVARAVAREIGVQVEDRARSVRRVDPEAARLHLEGRYFYGRWPEGLDRAVDRFEKAVARDPSFASAQGSLAMCEVDRSFSRPPKETLERARQAALHGTGREPPAAPLRRHGL